LVHFVYLLPLTSRDLIVVLSSRFVNGQEEIDQLPDSMKNSMFTLLSEDDFRLDISSTELRNNAKNTI